MIMNGLRNLTNGHFTEKRGKWPDLLKKGRFGGILKNEEVTGMRLVIGMTSTIYG